MGEKTNKDCIKKENGRPASSYIECGDKNCELCLCNWDVNVLVQINKLVLNTCFHLGWKANKSCSIVQNRCPIFTVIE